MRDPEELQVGVCWARGRDAQGAAELAGPGSHLQLAAGPKRSELRFQGRLWHLG